MEKLLVLEALIILKEIKSIKTTKIYTFLNNYDKIKIKGQKILFNYLKHFVTKI